MKTSGSGGSDAWMMLIPAGALVIFTTFASGGTAGLLYSLNHLVRGALDAVADLVSRLF
jgi:hypothetical protein